MMLGSFDEFLDEKQQIVKDRALESENISRSTLPALACRLLLHLFSCAMGREGRCKRITLACALNVSATLGLPLLMARVPSLPTLLRL